MELIIFIGLPGSGKSSFYRQHFFQSHVRLSLDLLRTRHRERVLLQACLQLQQPMVVDNTSVTVAERAVYISAGHAAQFRVVGYFFQSRVAECIARNATRSGRERVPEVAIADASKRLVLPSYAEGFDQLHFVRLTEEQGFQVEAWEGT
ncbi:MAG: ATP-binding protein [Chloroflexaceae bacterium]|nr:ATP-binding protein [Chloroflexaceae bacterium]